ncbi:dihydropyrimidinase [Acuticoccus sp. MNP-M23]|uniref:dihydropyrimidinase n=1 Tax=Acuticoccus sp. MNP-M23 TaxID=3072793 RepID=UPI00281527EF|nr:dihydropyrimidinase [Acuticoccus sp. MNP-M23]WMS44026.1 dihydropyrimidinase [Acuticoccus sp. MNP-M23]
MSYDLVIKGGLVATASDTFAADVGIRDGKIAAIAAALDGGAETIDATAKLVLPGAIETHAHIEQESATGAMTADDYRTGSISALYGGNTSFVPFAAQHRGQSVTDTLALYHERAEKSVIDYSFHLIVTDPTEEILKKELPEAFAGGITSFKVFLTYDKMIVPDEAMLDILVTAREHGALTMVHAENNALIKWMVKRLVETGHTAPKYHAVSHPAAAEAEAINRAITLANFVGAPLLIVHVSTEEGANLVADARRAGHPIFGETCPQYLFLTRDDLDKPGAEGAKFCCSPPLRDVKTQEDLWRHLQAGTFHLWSSDHAPYRFDESGKLSAGPNPPFNRIANGMPGIAMRVPLLMSEGVRKGRLSLNDFVALTATNAAKLFGMHPQKGTIAVGADADIAIWDPEETRTVTAADMHDAMDYTPFEGMEITGWPTTVITRGKVALSGGELHAEPGDGKFIARQPFDFTGYTNRPFPELDPAAFGVKLID